MGAINAVSINIRCINYLFLEEQSSEQTSLYFISASLSVMSQYEKNCYNYLLA